ncbi:MAG: hypothetical protein EAS51_13185 [Microbacteriaceae bacterium]|nr:MAG: hypothetical protein EAS51_13185 [Microbacteriaceae bacterium]
MGRLTLRLRELRQEKVELDESIRRLPELRQQLAQAQRRETELLSANESSLEPQRAELREIEASVLRIRRGGSQVEDYASELRRLHDGLDAFNERVVALRSITVPQSFRDWVATIQERVEGLVKALYEVLQEGEQSAESQRTSLAQGEQRLLELAAPLKEQLSEAEDGLGQVSAEIRALGSQIESLESLEVESGQLESELARIGGQRDGLLDEVEEQLERVFDSRAGVAKEVTSQLGAKAAIRVEHLADVTRLAEYLTNALRGSGIQYRAVVERLCAAYLPRTLLQAVESGDAEGIASAAGIQVERAFRVLQALDTPSNLVELANLTLDDRADYFLLHGSEMKNVDQLSTGQKCAVTLPILMTELDRALLLDQPEDHLDNEFLVQNVLPGLARRAAAHAQTIVATHNANIPVLGEADKVVALSSDGKRGFVSIEGSLDDKPVVTVIEAVMEGGVDAFKERARFYAASEGR